MLKRKRSSLLVGVLGLGVFIACDTPSYQCPSTAMLPTMDAGDRFKIVLQPYRKTPPARGDVIVFKMPENVPENFRGNSVKRIVALSGDRIALSEYRAVINGRPAEEPYIAIPPPAKRVKGGAAPGDVPEQLIPAGMCYVLGDNRGNSLDSRYFGPIPLMNIKAKATVITKAQDKSRVGRQLSPPANKPYLHARAR